MATIMTHALLAGTLYKLALKEKNKKVLWICLLGSVLPDLDVIGFAFGIKYADMLGHRGFTHSFVFAFLFASLCLLFFRQEKLKSKIKLFILFYASIISHAFLDMLTNGGLGVGLLIPFNSERYFFPHTPIEVSPLGVAGFLSQRGIDVILNEVVLVGLPCFVILVAVTGYRLQKSRKISN